MAAAAIGVSHLVQSTRAGAEFGFALVWAVVLANIFKYPFLEFGPRYALATGKNMIEGYAKMSPGHCGFSIFLQCSHHVCRSCSRYNGNRKPCHQFTGIDLPVLAWSAIILLLSPFCTWCATPMRCSIKRLKC
jgi:Mn2+/Fe2+ NRAMP family transporter